MHRLAAPALLPLLLALAGCAQGPTLDQRLSVFVNRPESELVAAMGVPARIHEVEGRRFLQYETRRTVAFAGPPEPYPWGWGGPWRRRGFYGPPSTVYGLVGCDITFALRDGRVESYTFRGDGCG
jgi:hypothetical protein